MSSSSLSACLIVRDEEKFLAGCLESLAGVVDEVMLVDTGSSDASLDIAREFGARIIRFESSGPFDFARARNFALANAHGDWSLYIDADERVASVDLAALREQMATPEIACLTVAFRPITGMTRYWEPRLFRIRDDVRFEGVIHETHLPSLYACLQREGLRMEHSSMAIDHLGYDGPQDHKHDRNLPLLRKRLESSPARARRERDQLETRH